VRVTLWPPRAGKKRPLLVQGPQEQGRANRSTPKTCCRSGVRIRFKPEEEFPAVSNLRRPASAEKSPGLAPGPVTTDSIQRCHRALRRHSFQVRAYVEIAPWPVSGAGGCLFAHAAPDSVGASA